MSANANANPLKSVPASRSAREFVAVCARHNVPYGDLNCLPTLLRELKANKHFAMHFWSVVVGQLDKQAAEQDAVLAAVVEAVTGRTPAEVREAGPSQRILLEKLQRLLNGQDAEPEEVTEAGAAAATTPDKRASSASTTAPGAVAEDVLPIRRVSHGKHRRVGKRIAIEHEQVAPVTNPAWTRDESLRLVLMPEPPASGNRTAEEPQLSRGMRPQLRSTGAVPLSGYAEEGSRRSLTTGALVVTIIAALLAGGTYVHRRGWSTQAFDRLSTSVRAGYGSAVAAWKGNPAENPAGSLSSSNSTALPLVQSTAPLATPSTPPTSSPSTTSVPQSRASASASVPTTVVPASQTTTPAQTPEQKVRGGALTPEQSMAVAAAYNQMHEGLDLAAPATDGSSGLVKVPEGEMNAHLIASRVPVLPDDARANGITGVVRMQATISRNGYVSRLHVLQGPSELRPAALAAVGAWRYRPYLVNGQPMDVSTIITVDFSSLE